MSLTCKEHFSKQLICNKTDYICYGCIHDQVFPINILQNIWKGFFYLLQTIITGVSSFVGLSGEVSKVSISMGLLKYNEYEATNISYYISAGSNLIFLIYLLFFRKNRNYIDAETVLILFPAIVISSDIGNYFNRQIADQYIVVVTMLIEGLLFILLFNLPNQLKNDYKSNNNLVEKLKGTIKNVTDSSVCVSNIQDSGSEGQFEQKKKNQLKLILQIFVIQFFLQVGLFSRGGSEINYFNIEYSGITYKLITLAIYVFSFVLMFCLINKYNDQLQILIRQADPTVTKHRSRKWNIILALFVFIPFSFSGIAGTGAGLIMVPICILKEELNMTILNAIHTMIYVQFLIDICLIQQSILNINNSIQFSDQLFFFLMGVVSCIITILLMSYSKVEKEENQYKLIYVILFLFFFDFSLGIYQMIEFKSPICNEKYFSISIHDCNQNCPYKS